MPCQVSRFGVSGSLFFFFYQRSIIFSLDLSFYFCLLTLTPSITHVLLFTAPATITGHLSGTSTSTSDNAKVTGTDLFKSYSKDVAVTGVAAGDSVTCSPSGALSAEAWVLTCYVSSAGNVKVSGICVLGTCSTLPALNIYVWKY
jgi:hypothetical protein